MISFVQAALGQATGAIEADANSITNTAHNCLAVTVGWTGATDAVTLDIEDTLGNIFKFDPSDGAQVAGGSGSGSHTISRTFFCRNCKPGANVVKGKSSVAGDISVAVVEMNPGSGMVMSDATYTGATALGVGTLAVTETRFTVLSNIWMLWVGYAQPMTHVFSGSTTGTFPGGSPNIRAHVAHAVKGSLCMLDQIYPSTLSGFTAGLNVTFDPTTAPAAAILNSYALFAATVNPSVDYALPAVTISPGSGEYSSAQSVTLACAVPGMTIYYTTDGTTPTTSSSVYSSAISVTGATTIKAIAHDPSAFYYDSPVSSATLDVFTGSCLNPHNIIDGDDTSFSDLICNGSPGDIVAVRAHVATGTLGSTGVVRIDFEVTQNDLVAPSQTLPAWQVSAFIGGVETVLESAAPGGGTVARHIVQLLVPPGTVANTLAAKIAAICQIPGSTGGVHVKVYGAYLLLPTVVGFGNYFGSLFGED